MERSRKLVLTNWTKANDALNVYFVGNKTKLADHAKMSRTTITAFFKQEPVREAEFRKLCLALRLNWEEVSTVQAIPTESFANASQLENETDPLQQVREHCRQKILSLHSRMRLLSGEEIGVDQLYVDVWVLNRSPRTYQVSQDKLLQTFDLRNDRLGLGDRIKRNPGFEVANANAKLLILGKPGAGKTTFLKHLAVDWCKGQFQPDLIAVRTNDKPAALRAFYFDLALSLDLSRDLALPRVRALALSLDLSRARILDLDLVLSFALSRTLTLDLSRARILDLSFALAHNLDPELTGKLEQLRIQLPSPENQQHFQKWWQTQGQQWLEQLRQEMIQHRNIGHNWQFDQQQQQLKRYYDANHFLVKLMKIEGAVSQEVRNEIEDSLLLPWEELQRRYPEIYGSNSSPSKPQPDTESVNSNLKCNDQQRD